MERQPSTSNPNLHNETDLQSWSESEPGGKGHPIDGQADWQDDMATSIDAVELRKAQITQLYHQAASGIYGALISCILVTFLLWNIASKTHLVIWSISVILLYLARHSMVLAFRRSPRTGQSVLSWGKWFCILSAIAGLIWGLGTVVLFPHESVIHQAVMALVIGGLCSGVTIVYCPVKMAYIPFALLAGIPIASRFLYEGTAVHIVIGCVMLVYVAVIIETGNHMHDTTAEILKLKSEKNRFIEHLLATSEKLRASEARYRQMFEGNRAIQLLVDPESGDIVDANPAAWEFYGHDSDRLRRLKIFDINTLPAEQIFREMAEIRSEQKTHFLSQHRLASGEVRDMEVYCGPIDVQGRQLLYLIVQDITERGKALEALEESEETYRRIFSNIEDVYFEILLDGTVVQVSPSVRRILGYSREEALGIPVQGVYAFPEERPVLLQKLREDGAIQDYELRIVCKDGKARHCQINARLIHDEAGNPLRICGILRDVTERKRSEEALEESERRYRLLIEGASDAVYLTDHLGNFTYLNQVALLRTGFTEAELIGQSYLTTVHPDYRAEVAQFYVSQFRDKIPETYYELPVLAKQGDTIWIGQNVQLLMEGKRIVGFQSIARDITDRHKAQLALMESEERLRQLAENVDDIIMLIEPTHPYSFIYVSPAYERVTHRAVEELYRDPPAWLESISENSRVAISQMFDDFVDGRTIFNSEFQIIRPSGDARWIWATGFTIKDSEGKINRLGMIARDITKRKIDEERLEHLVKEMKDFAYTLSHDCRSPIINIKGFANELEAAVATITPVVRMGVRHLDEQQRAETLTILEGDIPEALDFIQSSTSRMENLINGILGLSRLERRELNIEPLDMNLLVTETLKSLSYEIDETQTRVLFSELPQIAADRLAMEQIMANLLSNALKFRDPERPQEITISGVCFPDETAFVVRDQGRGVDPAYLTQIFQMFHRGAEESTSGEGMGLAVVRTLVRRHGGRIWCESNLGSGSAFTFTIPSRLGSSKLP